jgi:energy-coupling factor transporter transmembrane protein EcfT
MALNRDDRLFRYTGHETPIHRVPAGIKLVAMLAATIGVYAGNFYMLAGISAVLASITPVARISRRALIRGVRVILWYAIFILVFRLLGKPVTLDVWQAEFRATGVYLWQLSAVLLAGTIFYETTGTLDIFHTLGYLQRFVREAGNPIYQRVTGKKLPENPTIDIALLLSLTISFIPRIFQSWDDLGRAWDARGGTLKKTPPNILKRYTTLLPLLVERLLAVAADTDRAIRNRSRQ